MYCKFLGCQLATKDAQQKLLYKCYSNRNCWSEVWFKKLSGTSCTRLVRNSCQYLGPQIFQTYQFVAASGQALIGLLTSTTKRSQRDLRVCSCSHWKPLMLPQVYIQAAKKGVETRRPHSCVWATLGASNSLARHAPPTQLMPKESTQDTTLYKYHLPCCGAPNTRNTLCINALPLTSCTGLDVEPLNSSTPPGGYQSGFPLQQEKWQLC